MRLFLSEYVCSGALSGQDLLPSLLREGRAMWSAVATDLARLPGARVVTTADTRVDSPAGVEVVRIDAAEDEARVFERLCRECDATLVIAPELEGELLRRCRTAAELSPQPLNCRPQAIELCADKYATHQHLQRTNVPLLPTYRWTFDGQSDGTTRPPSQADGPRFPLVVKPRCGAGSQSTYLCCDAVELHAHAAEYDVRRPETEPVVQPYVSGRALSVAALFDLQSQQLIQTMPIATQHISGDGRFQYLGGELPASDVDVECIERLIRQAAAAVPGLRGYVGFDLLIPDDPPHEPLLVEINPRLTTSYIGYRALATDNLASRLVGWSTGELTWKPGRVRFDADGSVVDRAGLIF